MKPQIAILPHGGPTALDPVAPRGAVVLAELPGEQIARNVHRMLEHDPTPPFEAGRPSVADAAAVAQATEALAPLDGIGMTDARTRGRRRAATFDASTPSSPVETRDAPAAG